MILRAVSRIVRLEFGRVLSVIIEIGRRPKHSVSTFDRAHGVNHVPCSQVHVNQRDGASRRFLEAQQGLNGIDLEAEELFPVAVFNQLFGCRPRRGQFGCHDQFAGDVRVRFGAGDHLLDRYRIGDERITDGHRHMRAEVNAHQVSGQQVPVLEGLHSHRALLEGRQACRFLWTERSNCARHLFPLG